MKYCDAFTAANGCRTKYTAVDKARRTPPEDWARLYLLSYLLTGDGARAEQCIVASLDVSAEDHAALRDWAHSWARRIVIHNALRLIAPQPETGTQDNGSRKSR